MPRNYYAVDYANEGQVLTAWGSKRERDAFVAKGNKRFTKTRKESDSICIQEYEDNATEAFRMGFI
jgi:hypothetical protein